jgi:lipoyl(octanoyl) transferase
VTAVLQVIDLGRRGYHETLELQRELRLDRLAGRRGHDMLLLVEHEPVYTLGRGTRESSLPLAPALLRARGATVVEVERGGDVTWHGPGQLVGYPILDLRGHRPDLHWYLRTLEQALIDALGRLDIRAGVEPGRTGVWTGGRKIASIGVHVKQWVTLHGFALNVTPDLSWFDAIVPCGISGVRMTSVSAERGGDTAGLWQATRDATVAAFAAAFDRAPTYTPPPHTTATSAIASGS